MSRRSSLHSQRSFQSGQSINISQDFETSSISAADDSAHAQAAVQIEHSVEVVRDSVQEIPESLKGGPVRPPAVFEEEEDEDELYALSPKGQEAQARARSLASKAQEGALRTVPAKALSRPPGLPTTTNSLNSINGADTEFTSRRQHDTQRLSSNPITSQQHPTRQLPQTQPLAKGTTSYRQRTKQNDGVGEGGALDWLPDGMRALPSSS